MNIGTRSQVKGFVRQGLVTVNGVTVKSPDVKVDENTDEIFFRGERLLYRKFVYYMMNKPVGVVSATKDNVSGTVLELLRPQDRRDGIFPAGRLDKDTEGFLLLTDDGELAHRLLSPGKHVDKTYRVSLSHPLTDEDSDALERGVDIGEERMTLPASLERLDDTTILLTIHEGKFHQVKRMLQAVGNRVTALKRISFGGLKLDEALKPGEYRELTEEELQTLQKA
jgi:16S rRNA pseudouridine516 synthase